MTPSTKHKRTRQPDHRSADNWLERALGVVAQARVAVLGDYCLDAYWTVEPDESELSVETGLPVRRVSGQRYSLGGAGNVTANLKALGVARSSAIGLLGGDVFGAEMIRLMKISGINTRGLRQSADHWQTPVYAKPLRDGRELNRFDFGVTNRISGAQVAGLLAALDEAAASSTAVIINQQLPASYLSPGMIAGINRLITRHPQVPFLIDSRDHARAFKGAILKLNAHEAARIIGRNTPLETVIHREATRADAVKISAKTGRPVFVTRGACGLLAAAGGRVHELPGIRIVGGTDPVGAGDTVIAALAAVIGRSGDMEMAARLANLAASVTVRKLRTTGTATPAELRAIGPNPEYSSEPEGGRL